MFALKLDYTRANGDPLKQGYNFAIEYPNASGVNIANLNRISEFDGRKIEIFKQKYYISSMMRFTLPRIVYNPKNKIPLYWRDSSWINFFIELYILNNQMNENCKMCVLKFTFVSDFFREHEGPVYLIDIGDIRNEDNRQRLNKIIQKTKIYSEFVLNNIILKTNAMISLQLKACLDNYGNLDEILNDEKRRNQFFDILDKYKRRLQENIVFSYKLLLKFFFEEVRTLHREKIEDDFGHILRNRIVEYFNKKDFETVFLRSISTLDYFECGFINCDGPSAIDFVFLPLILIVGDSNYWLANSLIDVMRNFDSFLESGDNEKVSLWEIFRETALNLRQFLSDSLLQKGFYYISGIDLLAIYLKNIVAKNLKLLNNEGNV